LDFFHGSGSTQHALNSFLVMQGNILVTQHVVRLVLLQTRDSLYQQLALITQMPVNGVGGVAGDQMNEAAETIATELLDGLHSIPIECVGLISSLLPRVSQLISSGRHKWTVLGTERYVKPSSPEADASTIRRHPVDGIISNSVSFSSQSVSRTGFGASLTV
jgi:hypothetical protein